MALLQQIYNLVPKKERKLVLDNFFSLSSLQGLNYLLPVLVLPYLIRIIGPEKFGLIAFAQAFVQYFLILTDYGFSITATREIALCQERQDKVCKIFSQVLTVKIILAVVSFIILALVLRFIPRFRSDWQVYFLSFGVVLGNTLFPVWFFQGTEKMRYIASLNIVSGILFTVGVFVFVKTPQDYLMVPFLQSALSLVVGLTGLSIVFRKFNMPFIRQSYPSIRDTIKAGWDIFSSIVAVNAYTATRVFALGLLTNNTLTGYFAIAEKLAGVIQSFPLASFSQALYPRITRIFARNKRKAFELMDKIQLFTMNAFLLTLPLFFIASSVMVELFCGKKYDDSAVALQLLLFSVFFVGANAFRVQFLLVCGKAKWYARIHIIMAMIGLPLIFASTYFLSYLGTCLTAVLVEGGIFMLTSARITRLEKQYG